jgi:hypothetical protein
MPTIRAAQSVAAGADYSPLVGNQYEYLPFAARVSFAMISSADDVTATVYSGTDVLQQVGPVSNKGAAGVIVNPDDFLLEDVAMAGDRLNIAIHNGGAAAADVQVAVIITPL